ncbi:MAG: helix-turn-helix domain-containing protein [Bacteroidota bacterium]
MNDLQDILNDIGISGTDFAQAIGVGKNAVYKLLRGDTKKITPDMAKKINNKYPQYAINFLLGLNRIKKDTSNQNEDLASFVVNEPTPDYAAHDDLEIEKFVDALLSSKKGVRILVDKLSVKHNELMENSNYRIYVNMLETRKQVQRESRGVLGLLEEKEQKEKK